jgi:hypothetical protein
MDDFEKTQENTENTKAEDLEAGLLNEEADFKYSYLGNGYECVLLGVTIVIGGQLYGWNAGFSSGFGSYFIGQVMVGLAYIVLLSCLAESSATLAFPGGTYGLARAVLDFFLVFWWVVLNAVNICLCQRHRWYTLENCLYHLPIVIQSYNQHCGLYSTASQF